MLWTIFRIDFDSWHKHDFEVAATVVAFDFSLQCVYQTVFNDLVRRLSEARLIPIIYFLSTVFRAVLRYEVALEGLSATLELTDLSFIPGALNVFRGFG